MMSTSNSTTEAPPGRLDAGDPMASYRASTNPKMEAPHPGAILRDVIPALEMDVSAAARDLGISRGHLHAILGEKKPITPAMALRIGKFVGNGARIWLDLQSAYDLWHAERELAKEIAKIPTRGRGLKAA